MRSDNSSALHSSTFGRGKPIVLIHGISSSSREWIGLSGDLVQHGYQTFLLDLFGHGNSPQPSNIDLYTACYQIQATLQWMNELAVQFPLDLIGHSFGGYLALQIASRFPEKVGRLILINPFYCSQQLSRTHSFIFSKSLLFIRLWQIYRQLFKVNTASPLVLNIPKDLDHQPIQFNKVTHPTLILWGKEDRTLNSLSFPVLARLLQNAIAQPLPELGHVPHLANPRFVNDLIMSFLSHPNASQAPKKLNLIDSSQGFSGI